VPLLIWLSQSPTYLTYDVIGPNLAILALAVQFNEAMDPFQQQPSSTQRASFHQPGGMQRPTSAAPPTGFQWKSLGGARVLSAEFLSTMLLVFTINAAIVSISRTPGPALLQTAAAIGMAYATLVHTFGHICGAHMNPAVTVALLSARKINLSQALLYIVVQSKTQCIPFVDIPGPPHAVPLLLTHGSNPMYDVRPIDPHPAAIFLPLPPPGPR